MTKAGQAGLSRFIPSWATAAARRSKLPSDGDIARAVRCFRATDALCRFNTVAGNEGFSVSISFNPVEFRSSSADFLEVALRAAHFSFAPKNPAQWTWSESLKAFVHGNASQLTLRESKQDTVTAADASTARTEMEVGGEFGTPLAGRVKVSAKQGFDRSLTNTRSVARTSDSSLSVDKRWAEIHRRGDDFELRLGSPPNDDLVRLNPDFDRIAVLTADEPSSVQPDDVSVTMRVQMKGELWHSLRIRDAGGVWSRLVETRNKAIISEILIAKFLKPVHSPQRLWPRRTK